MSSLVFSVKGIDFVLKKNSNSTSWCLKGPMITGVLPYEAKKFAEKTTEDLLKVLQNFGRCVGGLSDNFEQFEEYMLTPIQCVQKSVDPEKMEDEGEEFRPPQEEINPYVNFNKFDTSLKKIFSSQDVKILNFEPDINYIEITKFLSLVTWKNKQEKKNFLKKPKKKFAELVLAEKKIFGENGIACKTIKSYGTEQVFLHPLLYIIVIGHNYQLDKYKIIQKEMKLILLTIFGGFKYSQISPTVIKESSNISVSVNVIEKVVIKSSMFDDLEKSDGHESKRKKRKRNRAINEKVDVLLDHIKVITSGENSTKENPLNILEASTCIDMVLKRLNNVSKGDRKDKMKICDEIDDSPIVMEILEDISTAGDEILLRVLFSLNKCKVLRVVLSYFVSKIEELYSDPKRGLIEKIIGEISNEKLRLISYLYRDNCRSGVDFNSGGFLFEYEEGKGVRFPKVKASEYSVNKLEQEMGNEIMKYFDWNDEIIKKNDYSTRLTCVINTYGYGELLKDIIPLFLDELVQNGFLFVEPEKSNQLEEVLNESNECVKFIDSSLFSPPDENKELYEVKGKKIFTNLQFDHKNCKGEINGIGIGAFVHSSMGNLALSELYSIPAFVGEGSDKVIGKEKAREDFENSLVKIGDKVKYFCYNGELYLTHFSTISDLSWFRTQCGKDGCPRCKKKKGDSYDSKSEEMFYDDYKRHYKNKTHGQWERNLLEGLVKEEENKFGTLHCFINTAIERMGLSWAECKKMNNLFSLYKCLKFVINTKIYEEYVKGDYENNFPSVSSLKSLTSEEEMKNFFLYSKSLLKHSFKIVKSLKTNAKRCFQVLEDIEEQGFFDDYDLLNVTLNERQLEIFQILYEKCPDFDFLVTLDKFQKIVGTDINLDKFDKEKKYLGSICLNGKKSMKIFEIGEVLGSLVGRPEFITKEMTKKFICHEISCQVHLKHEKDKDFYLKNAFSSLNSVTKYKLKMDIPWLSQYTQYQHDHIISDIKRQINNNEPCANEQVIERLLKLILRIKMNESNKKRRAEMHYLKQVLKRLILKRRIRLQYYSNYFGRKLLKKYDESIVDVITNRVKQVNEDFNINADFAYFISLFKNETL